MSPKNARRAVIVAGARTPFVRAFTDFLALDTIRLGAAAVGGLLERTGLDRRELDSVIWGGVVLPGGAPNVGREIVLDLGLPPSVEAMTVSRACASGLQSITLAAAAIERGEADVVIAGGSDSTSNAEVKMGPALCARPRAGGAGQAACVCGLAGGRVQPAATAGDPAPAAGDR